MKMEDLVDGLQVDEISAKDITIDGKKPSLEGHTHEISDVDGLEDELQSIRVVYAECASDQSDAQKTATTPSGDFTPEVGSVVAVHFSRFCINN